MPLTDIVRDLFDAIDADKIEADATTAAGRRRARRRRNADRPATELVGQAANVFTGPLIDLIDSIRRDKEQTIDHDNLDTLLRAEWAGDAGENAKQIAQDFADYLKRTATRSRR